MNWQTKAKIQNLVASLPAAMADPVYYFIQRRFGGLCTTASDTMTNTWDAANRLLAVSRQQSAVSNVYNGVGDRVGQTVESAPTDFALDSALASPEVIYTSQSVIYPSTAPFVKLWLSSFSTIFIRFAHYIQFFQRFL
ncbi:MAG: hypothetical protein KDI79_29370 [Anaerolineae bacterium]|nr:hypothetical protein [Anaerolineae bacterium]